MSDIRRTVKINYQVLYNVPEDDVLLSFYDKASAALFEDWWLYHGGIERFTEYYEKNINTIYVVSDSVEGNDD